MLADFSTALLVDDARNIGRIGSEIVTEPNHAPELVIHPDHRVKFSIDIDMWAWGLTEGRAYVSDVVGCWAQGYTFTLVCC